MDENFELRGQVGEGTFGCVYLAIDNTTKEERAIKILKGKFEWSEIQRMRELECICDIGYHPFIVKLYSIHRLVDGHCNLVFEFMQRGTVQEFLIHRMEHRLGCPSSLEIASILRQTLEALLHLHKRGWMHRDVKPDNLLLDSNGTCKLADFSLARRTGHRDNVLLTQYVSTRWYRAPEIVLGAFYQATVDIFALGCVMAEMIRLRPLLPGEDNDSVLAAMLSILPHDGWIRENLRLPPNTRPRRSLVKWLQYPPPRMVKLLSGLLVLDPSSRLTASQALQCDFFQPPACPTPVPTRSAGKSPEPRHSGTMPQSNTEESPSSVVMENPYLKKRSSSKKSLVQSTMKTFTRMTTKL